MKEQVMRILSEILTVLLPIMVSLIAEYLRRKIGNERLRRIKEELATKQELAGLAVRFAQQTYINLGGLERSRKAAQWLEQQAAARGVPITDDEIQGLISAALRSIKDEFGEEWAKIR